MQKLAIRPLTRGLLSFGKRGFHHITMLPKKRFSCKTEKIIQNKKKYHSKRKDSKTTRNMLTLEICPLTRGL